MINNDADGSREAAFLSMTGMLSVCGESPQGA